MTDSSNRASALVTLPVKGMTCASCAARLQRVLANHPGVDSVSVNLAAETAQIRFSQTLATPADLVDAIQQAGFHVPTESVRLAVQGMTCASCVQRIESLLRAQRGVISAQVSLASEQAIVSLQQGTTSPAGLMKLLESIGYKASVAPSSEEARIASQREELRRSRKQLLRVSVAALLTFPLVSPMLLTGLGLTWALPTSWVIVFASVVQFWAGAGFYRGAWAALRAGTSNMDVLVALGTTAAYGVSIGSLASDRMAHGSYFEASASVITLVMFGKWLEARAKRRTLQALRALASLRPNLARVLREQREVEVAAESVGHGDVVVVRPGERIPVDGRVARGESEIDQSLITGESQPVARAVGDFVPTGAINGSGILYVEATQVGDESMLSRIIALVRDAQASRAPIQRLVDRVAAIFVPVVVTLAMVTFAGWMLAGAGWGAATLNAVAVLVVACPCALGLATPAALMVGIGAAARAGILIKDADALERALTVQVVAFDKTGTLTAGRPEIVQVETAGCDRAGLVSLAAGALHGSEHPFAAAVLRLAESERLSIDAASEFRALPGRGVQAQLGGHQILVGGNRLMAEWHVDLSAWQGRVPRPEAGLTVSWVASDHVLLGWLGARDPIRHGAPDTIRRLLQRGIMPVLLTGDNLAAATSVAHQLGIEQVRAEMLPADKAREVQRLHAAGYQVAMVGDGINDAPALAVSDLSLAMSSGSEVALQTAGVALMRPEPALVVDALEICRRTARILRQNLFWAFAYNVVAIPLAAFGLLTPALAGAAMAFSSVSVVSNALRLYHWKATA